MQQYGIRLAHEYSSISYVEFNQLLAGINSDTPLGYTVSIRAEKDQKKISQMTKHEKELRRKWREFTDKKNKPKYIYVSKENISKFLSKTFG